MASIAPGTTSSFVKLIFSSIPPFQQLNLLQGHQEALKQDLAKEIVPDDNLCEQIMNMGFDKATVDMALRNVANNMDAAIEMLLKLQNEGTYTEALEKLVDGLPIPNGDLNAAGPSTSSGSKELKEKIQEKIDTHKVSLVSWNFFLVKIAATLILFLHLITGI